MKFWASINGKRFKVDRRGNKTRTDRVGEGHSDPGHPNWYGFTSYTNRKQPVQEQLPLGRAAHMRN